MIYLDHAATTPVRREVLEAMWPYLTGEFGNPSSTHGVGESAARAVTDARATVAAFLGVRASNVVFTSGGTEADNLAVKGISLATPRGRHIVTAATEHEAVLESCGYLERFHGFEVTFVELEPDGVVTPHALAAALRPDTTLVSIAHANNEIGTVQDLPALSAVAHSVGAAMHTDAVQSAAWLPMGLDVLGVDAVTIAGHKLGAPKGTGALAVRVPVEPLLHGGGQERGRRSGTENVAGAVGLAAAVSTLERIDVSPLRDLLIDGVLAAAPGAFLTGSRESRVAPHASFCFPGTSGEALLLELERHGIVCSSGSACAAGSDDPSHVLIAIGVAPEVAQTAVRFTLDASTTEAEVRETIARTADAVAQVAALR
jgi:cysteine desulfurase